MKIRSVTTRVVEIPFEAGNVSGAITPTTWHSLQTVLVRVEDTDGNVGWGEAFGYFIADATRAVIERLLKPLLEGTTVESIEEWNLRTQQQLHLFGRYGVTMFAISGVDMALWDLKAKRAKLPLYRLLGGGERTSLTTYASLVRYGDTDLAPRICQQALDEGYRNIKLHEADMAVVEACHRQINGKALISIDVNCSWDEVSTRAHVDICKRLGGIEWIEEPVFPPEDFAQLLRTDRFTCQCSV